MKEKRTDERVEEAGKLRQKAKELEDEYLQDKLAEQKALEEKEKGLVAELAKVRLELGEVEMEINTHRDGGEYIRASQIISITEVKGHTTDEEILEFIYATPAGLTTGQIQEHYGFSSATVSRRMKALLAAKLVTVEKKGTSKLWKTT